MRKGEPVCLYSHLFTFNHSWR
jgi:hypothetical protein